MYSLQKSMSKYANRTDRIYSGGHMRLLKKCGHRTNPTAVRHIIIQTTCRDNIKPPIEPVGQSATLMSALNYRSAQT